MHQILCLKGFYLFSKGRNFRGGLEKISIEHSSAFQVYFLICWFITMSVYGCIYINLYWLVCTRAGSHWPLHLVLMKAMASLCLVLLLFWAWSWNTSEAYMLSPVWPKLCLCGQQTWGFVTEIIQCWSEPHCPEGRWVRVLDEASLNQLSQFPHSTCWGIS